MDKMIEDKVSAYKGCILFTNKTTHEPIYPHQTSDKSWEDVSVYLFGPMPDGKHVVVVLDKTSRFPAAKIVQITAAPTVTRALSDVYASYGQPHSHQTDNGPPFNSAEFKTFSEDNSIDHIKTYPYHPQGNTVENFMRPIGKCMKTAHYNRSDKGQALDEMLSTYRATPHPSTGLPPGEMLFRSGYKRDFPRREPNQQKIEDAIVKDRQDRQLRSNYMNTSKHRRQSHLAPNDLVYVRNMVRNKFDPLFGPELHKVIDVKGNGTTLLRLADDRIVRRHLDDVKYTHRKLRDNVGTRWLENKEGQKNPEVIERQNGQNGENGQVNVQGARPQRERERERDGYHHDIARIAG